MKQGWFHSNFHFLSLQLEGHYCICFIHKLGEQLWRHGLGGLLWRTVLREEGRRAFLTRSLRKLWPWSMCSQEEGLTLSSSWLANTLLPETKVFLQRKQNWLITSTKLSSNSYFLIGIFWNSQLESLRELHP